jgi:phosphatidylserine decarboxylase
MFHFGGSTHALIFRPQVHLEFDLHGQTTDVYTANIPVRSRIATVQTAKQPDPAPVTVAPRP